MAVFPQSQAFTSPALEMAVGVGGLRWAAMALPAWHCMAFSAGQDALHGEPAVRPRKGQACQTGSVCVSCGVAPLECAVSQGGSEAGEPALFRGFFFFLRNIPLSAVLLTCFVESVVALPCQLHEDGLLSRLFFLSGDFRGELLELFPIVMCSLANCLVRSYRG